MLNRKIPFHSKMNYRDIHGSRAHFTFQFSSHVTGDFHSPSNSKRHLFFFSLFFFLCSCVSQTFVASNCFISFRFMIVFFLSLFRFIFANWTSEQGSKRERERGAISQCAQGISCAVWLGAYTLRKIDFMSVYKPLFNATRKMKNLLKKLIFRSDSHISFFRSLIAQLSFTYLFASSFFSFLRLTLFLLFDSANEFDLITLARLLPIYLFIFIHFLRRRWHTTIIFLIQFFFIPFHTLSHGSCTKNKFETNEFLIRKYIIQIWLVPMKYEMRNSVNSISYLLSCAIGIIVYWN